VKTDTLDIGEDSMDILSLIHDQTRDLRDHITTLTAQVIRAGAERDAAKDRAKCATAEVAKQRTLEEEIKKSRDAASDMAAEAQHVLEELDRKRQETLDSLICCQEEQKSLSQSLVDAQALAELALAEAETEQENAQKAEAEISRLLEDREREELDLRDAVLESVDIFLEQQADRIMSVFASEEQHQEFLRDYESLQQARLTDTHVGALCEERDELNKFMSAATVPAVKDTLQASLAAVEDQLRELFPGAFQLTDPPSPANQTEELFFYLGPDGRAVFLIPVKTSDWEAAQEDEAMDRDMNTMRIVWDMIRELGFKEKDGDFVKMRGRPVFKSRFDAKETIILHGFTAKYYAADILRFAFARVPSEVEEALVHENRTSEVAGTPSMRPARNLFHAAAINQELTFEDVLPEIDQTVPDIMSLRPDQQAIPEPRLAAGTYLRAVVTKEPPNGTARRPDVRSSSTSVRVADKLYQQRKWGGTSVPFDALVNITHLPSHEVEKAVIELRARKLLDSDRAEQGQYSLNSAKRKEIESLIKHKIKA
jgi:hypothetical protein